MSPKDLSWSDPEFLAVADDLTGALEVGAGFAAAGLSARVVTQKRLGECGRADALVIDTETRHATPDDACAAVERIAALAGSCRFVYKKTDSTLRGNIASELRGLGNAFPASPIIYVPGYPEMGRTLVDGHLLVDGVPVCTSTFARDALNPVQTGYVPELVGKRNRTVLLGPAGIAGAFEPAVYVVNSATGEDVREAAREFCRAGLRLAAGPAGFAGRLAEVAARRGPAPVRPPIRKCLLVNGSLHPRSREQVRAASQLSGPARDWVLLQPQPGRGTDHATEAGRAVAQVLRESEIDAIIVFGGDTAFGILRELGEPPLEPVGEAVPGVPVARIDLHSVPRHIRQAGRELFLVTKAGGFGPPDLLATLEHVLAHP